ncbi:MAG: helix-turn-helix domain-containing protein [Bacteroidetes bacterium]|nr:helix-turn-helix domain-containing protein [Bacteroidota bacterium]
MKPFKQLSAMRKAVRIFGSQIATASALGVSQMTISVWCKTRVPAEHVIKIEQLTDGLVTRNELRPDIYPQEEGSK